MKTLVAGIGNIFLGDDGFGCEVIRRLQIEALPGDVDAVDFGIRGMDLGYALMDGYDQVILVDTAARGTAPGTVHVIEPEIDTAPAALNEPLVAPHAMGPDKVLRLVAALGARRPRLLLVACEPAFLGGEDGHMGLSGPAADAVDRALAEIRAIVNKRLPQARTEQGKTATAHHSPKKAARLREA